MPYGEDVWRSYEREGFEPLERWMGSVVSAKWTRGEGAKDFGVQLELKCAVEAIELPEDSPAVNETTLWYSTGKKGKWQITNGGTDLWSPDDQSGFVKTSKFWKLVDRSIEIAAGVVERGLPTNSQVWIGLRALWIREAITYEGLTDEQTITLPAQLLASSIIAPSVAAQNGSAPAAPPAVVMAPPVAIAAAPSPPVSAAPAPPPVAVAPPPAPAAPSAPPPAPPPLSVVPEPQVARPEPWYATKINNDWMKWVQGQVLMKNTTTAATELFRKDEVRGYTDLANAINDDSYPLLDYMTENGWLRVVNSQYVMPV